MLKERWKRTWSKITQFEEYTPEVFVKCQWQTRAEANIFYVAYRWILAIIFCCGLVLSLLDLGRETAGIQYLKWPVYATNWSYTACTVQAVMAAYHVTQYYNTSKYSPEKLGEIMKMKTSYSVYWVLNSISVVTAIGVTSIYWTTVYNPEENTLDFVNLTVHVFNSVLMLLDLCLVSHPTKLLHCYWSLSFASTYLIFNALYYLAGGTDRQGKYYVYKVLNWRRPLIAMLACVVGLVFLVLVSVVVWFISLSRRRLAAYLLKPGLREEECTNIKERPHLPNQQDSSLKVVRVV